ncbi:Argh [Thalictrum thalictroides]|uniref:Argh n=1 Tax=Thalictrum thalictroides TaxID=46969 RepID=A0A7J6WPD4_THATH|nr:Argh [Thalictrum thalictroides]
MATVEGLKEEGISDSFMVLMELLSPLKIVVPSCQQILAWDRPVVTLLVFSATLIITYKEWIGMAIAALLVWGVREIYQAKRVRIKDRYGEIVVCTGSDQSSVESIVSAHHGLKGVQSIVQMANISILKIQSILLSRAPKHTNMVMMVMIGLAIFLAIVPLKFIIMTLTSYVFMMNVFKRGKNTENDRTERRLKEWWNSIPAIPVRIVDKAP